MSMTASDSLGSTVSGAYEQVHTRWVGIQLIVDNLPPTAGSEPQSGPTTFPLSNVAIPPTQKKSPRNGRLARGLASVERETLDSSYRARMSTARAMLASDLMNEAPNSLAKLRLQRGFSQQQLAKNIGTSQSHIAKIEAGTVNIYWDTATRIADALTVSLEELRPLIKVSSDHPRIVMEES